MKYTTITIVLTLLSINNVYSNKVLLSKVSSITLNHDRMTTGRRSNPVPQTSCVGGNACHSVRPKTIQCVNKGHDGYDIQWECKTELENKYKFGRTDVVCEGYDYPNDPYILLGSCGVEYTLEYTNEYNGRKYNRNSDDHSLCIFIGVCVLVVIVIAFNGEQRSQRFTYGCSNYDNGWWSGFGAGTCANSFSSSRYSRNGYGTGGGRLSSRSRTASGFGSTRRR